MKFFTQLIFKLMKLKSRNTINYTLKHEIGFQNERNARLQYIIRHTILE
jgi:hypothetical protein